ncbi:uncharacterized protein CEXT_743131 [Caerostris extrusa]|uniref:Secreted protein n=1 Tax=Caerostris extrusa TaxID=172846 RepID=A0AAV4UIZ0_CAEEX|nr:uncharacterized protein CEXT_743131 [Caerostris extrusa]
MFLFIISALLVAGVSTTEGTTCNNFDLVVCAFLVDGDKAAKSGFAETEDSLDKRCDQTLPVLKCLSDYAAKCPDTSFKHLADFFGDEYKTQTKLCSKKDELRQHVFVKMFLVREIGPLTSKILSRSACLIRCRFLPRKEKSNIEIWAFLKGPPTMKASGLEIC